MKTIAITIEEDILDRVDRLARQDRSNGANRSRIIRQAVREYISRLERQVEDARETTIVRRHRARLARQASALIAEQAKP